MRRPSSGDAAGSKAEKLSWCRSPRIHSVGGGSGVALVRRSYCLGEHLIIHLPIAQTPSQDLRANVEGLSATGCPTPTNLWPFAWRPNEVDPRTTSRT